MLACSAPEVHYVHLEEILVLAARAQVLHLIARLLGGDVPVRGGRASTALDAPLKGSQASTTGHSTALPCAGRLGLLCTERPPLCKVSGPPLLCIGRHCNLPDSLTRLGIRQRNTLLESLLSYSGSSSRYCHGA